MTKNGEDPMPTTDQVRYVSLIFPSPPESVRANWTSRLRFRTCTRSVNRWKSRAKRKWAMPFPPLGLRCECGARSKESIACGVTANVEPHGMIVRSSWPFKSESPRCEKGLDARLELISLQQQDAPDVPTSTRTLFLGIVQFGMVHPDHVVPGY